MQTTFWQIGWSNRWTLHILKVGETVSGCRRRTGVTPLERGPHFDNPTAAKEALAAVAAKRGWRACKSCLARKSWS